MKPNPHQFFRDQNAEPAITPSASPGGLTFSFSSPTLTTIAGRFALTVAIASLAVPALGIYLIRTGSGLAVFAGAAPFGAGTGFAFDYAGIMGMFAAAVQIIVIATGILWTLSSDLSARRIGHPILLAWATLWFVATLTGMSSPGSLEWISITSVAGITLLATVIRAANALTDAQPAQASLARITPNTTNQSAAGSAHQQRRAA